MSNLPVNGLHVLTQRLLGALPRGKRFGVDDLRRVCNVLGHSYSGSRQRLNALVKAGRVRELCVRDGNDRPLGFEWEVIA